MECIPCLVVIRELEGHEDRPVVMMNVSGDRHIDGPDYDDL
jgi:hypothetical protein